MLRFVVPVCVVTPLAEAVSVMAPVDPTAPIGHARDRNPELAPWLSVTELGAPEHDDAMPDCPMLSVYVVLLGAFWLVFVTVKRETVLVTPATRVTEEFSGATATEYTGVALIVVVAALCVEPAVPVNVTLPPPPLVLTL